MVFKDIHRSINPPNVYRVVSINGDNFFIENIIDDWMTLTTELCLEQASKEHISIKIAEKLLK